MTHEQLVEEMKPTEEKQAIQSEIAVFWDEIANNLPKSIERSALGDEKIFNAFATAYPKIRHHLLTTTAQRVREETIGKILKYVQDFEEQGDYSIPIEYVTDFLSTLNK